MKRSGPKCFHQSLHGLLAPKIIHPVVEYKVCRNCFLLVFIKRSEESGLEEANLLLFLSAQPERLHLVQFASTELVSGQCIHKLKFPNVTDGICFVCVFSVACCVPSRNSWERRALGKDSRGWVRLWGASGPVWGRRIQGWQAWREESHSAAWEAAAHRDRDCSEEHSTGPRDNPMNFLGIRGDWQSLMQFRKPLSCPKLCLQARICLQGHNGQWGRAVYETVLFSFCLM